MKARGLFALCLAGCFLHPGSGLALEAKDIFKLAEPSIVVVLASDTKGEKNSLGSGVLIAPLEIITSCKVVEAAADIVVTQGSALRKGRLRFQDRERDVCQLHIEEPLPAGKPAVAAATSATLESGQDLFTISAPRGMERIISRGMVSGLREISGTSGRLIQTDAAAAGSPGGGVFDASANLVGIITPQFRQAETESYAVPVEWISELAKRTPDLTTAAASTVTATAANPAAVAAPADARWRPAKGDRWRYQLVDGKKIVGKINIQVLESGPGRVRERITRDGSPGFSVERDVLPEFSTQTFLPLVALQGGYQLIELAAYLPPDSEIQPSTFSSQVPGNVSMPQLGTRNVLWTVKLAGRERVRVPAGEFDTWRIDASSTVNMQYGDVRLRYSIWYSAASRRAVKIHLATIWPIAVQSSFETLELIAFEKAN